MFAIKLLLCLQIIWKLDSPCLQLNLNVRGILSVRVAFRACLVAVPLSRTRRFILLCTGFLLLSRVILADRDHQEIPGSDEYRVF